MATIGDKDPTKNYQESLPIPNLEKVGKYFEKVKDKVHNVKQKVSSEVMEKTHSKTHLDLTKKKVKIAEKSIPYDPERDPQFQRVKKIIIDVGIVDVTQDEADPETQKAKHVIENFINHHGGKSYFNKLGLSDENQYQKVLSFLEKAHALHGNSKNLCSFIEEQLLNNSLSSLKPFQNSQLVTEMKTELWGKYAPFLDDNGFNHEIIEHISMQNLSDDKKFDKLMEYGYNLKEQTIDLLKFSSAFAVETFDALNIDILRMDTLTSKCFAAVQDGVRNKAKILLGVLEKTHDDIVPELEEFKRLLILPYEKDVSMDNILNALEP